MTENIKTLDYMLTPEMKTAFIPCRSCGNIMTKECFDACMPEGRFTHYQHRPGTDILELAPFPLAEVLKEPDAYYRLLTVCIYLMSVVDYLQHTEEYQRNRELYKESQNGRQDTDSTHRSDLSDGIESQDLLSGSQKADTPHQVRT